MNTTQELRHISVRAVSGTARSYSEDWHALFDAHSIPTGPFEGRLLAWINAKLLASHTSVNGAMQAFAEDQGFNNWSSMGTFDASAP